jgi:hypothetical protein
MTELASEIANAIDRYRIAHPGVSVNEILSVLEDIRHDLTEALLRASKR